MTVAPRINPTTDSPECARRLLAAAKRPVLVIGFGAVIANAGANALALASSLPNLTVVATPRAKGIFPEDHPQYRGVIGFAGHAEARRCLFDEGDLAVIVGTRLGELTSDNWDPRWQQLRAIRIDIASQSANWLGHCECTLVGDASALLHQLIATTPAKSGTRFVPPEPPDERSSYETDPVPCLAALAILGDAEFLMTGFELHTATEMNVNVVVIVLNDEGHGMVRVGAKAHCGGQAPSADFAYPVNLVRAARAMGAFALRATTQPRLVSALQRALHRHGPTVIEVPIDRGLVPPLGERLRALSQSFGASKEGATS
jgi:thiamine pyrophosphate-dependent acetolactate synthase large subunit-like protein